MSEHVSVAANGRIDRLRGRLAERGVDGAVLRRPANVYYLAGHSPGPIRPGLLVVGPERAVLVAPGSAEAARAVARPGVEVIGYAVPGATTEFVADVDELSAAALAAALEQAGLAGRRVGVERAQLSALHHDVVRRLTDTAAVTGREDGVGAVDGLVESLRRVKDTDELALFRAAVELNDVGFEAARRSIRPGVPEQEIEIAIVAAMERAAGVPIDILDDTNGIISGPRTWDVVGLATPRALEPGDLVIVDLNPFVGYYKGDTTRTYSVGPPSAEHRRMYEAVRRALDGMERTARPGVPARQVYAAFGDAIVAAGYGAGLLGHGGHAIGLEHLERPYIIPGDEMPLEEGMTITFEPGIYLPGIGGIRHEDNYVVTATGLERLSRYPQEMIVCD